jgi:tRNA(Ile)-lysidine synthase
LMRLARGSALQGLAGMQRDRVLSKGHDVQLIRPLLNVPKDRLEATLRAIGKPWMVDPTNENLAYERPRLRANRAHREALGLTDEGLARSAHRLDRANQALTQATTALERLCVQNTRGIVGQIGAAEFYEAPTELQIRLIGSLLARYGGSHRPAQLEEIERLVDQLAKSTKAMTLGGCYIQPAPSTISISREPGVSGLPKLTLDPGQTAIWDNRFSVTLAANAPTICQVRAMDARSYAKLRITNEFDPMPMRLAVTLPSFWANGVLIGAPNLPTNRHAACKHRTALCLALSQMCQSQPMFR